MREMNLALQAQGVSPERLKELQTVGGRLGAAGKTGLQMGALGSGVGALSGALSGGLPGAALGAATLGAGFGLGGGLGSYYNLKSLSNMSPEDIQAHAKAAEDKYGSQYSESLRKAGSAI